VTSNDGSAGDVAGPDREEQVAAMGRAAGSMRTVALTGGRWRAIEGVAVQLLQILSTMALARLLTPEDFGIVAVVTLVLLLFSLLTQFGFGASVVRRDSVDQGYLSSMFWASSLLGFAAALLATVLAPVFASLAGNAEAAPYLAVASLTLLFGMVRSVPRALLLRGFRFRETSAISVLGFVGYMAIAITLAATTDLGAWAIVAGRVGSAAFQLTAQWIVSGFLPSFHLRRSEVREDLGFNAAYLGMRGSQYLAKNVDYWYAGAALGPAALGNYYIAYVLPNLIRRRMTDAVSSPLFVTVSGFASDRERVRRAYLGAARLISLGAYPVLIGMALVAGDLMRVAFGQQWEDAIEPMAILAVAAALNVIGPVGSAILNAIGKPSRNIVMYLAWTAMILVGLALTIDAGGLTAVALVVLVATFLSKVFQVALLRGPIGLGWGSVLGAVWPATATSVVMAGAVFATRWLISGLDSEIIRLVLLVAVGAAVYLGFGFLAFRRVFKDASGDLRTMFVGGRVRRPVAVDSSDGET
jgi:O-antigen/teichoic acid export membrane protein